MEKKTKQIEFWQGDFGKDYTLRNDFSIDQFEQFYQDNFGISKTEINREFLKNFSPDIKILEVGCNVGNQLRHLQNQGFKHLYGIEIQKEAIEKARQQTKDINIIYGNAFDLPFKDNWFDLIFTSGVLIHIAPENLKHVLDEIYRCSNQYIWGFEYFSDTPEEIIYRGNSGFLWKQNFADIFLKSFADLKLIKEKKYKYIKTENIDQMFLLEK